MGRPLSGLRCVGDDRGGCDGPRSVGTGATGSPSVAGRCGCRRGRSGRDGHRRAGPRAGGRSRAGVGRVALRASPASASPRSCCNSSPASVPRVGRACWSPARNRTRRSPHVRNGSASRSTRCRSLQGASSSGVLQVAAAERPFLLAVDSIQTLRDAIGLADAGRCLPGASVHRRARGSGEVAGDRRAHDRSRHQGRRPRGASDLGACGRCRARLRR